jgi:uncharacterized repeat protein (TIGR01451 family)
MTSTRSLLAVVAIALACAFIPTATASASPGALKVLIAYSDGAHTEATLKSQIAAQTGVAAVDTFDAGAATPSVQTLEGYDLVLTFSNTSYSNAAVLGDNLATYADHGGIVTEFAFNWFNSVGSRLAGRWATGVYSAFAGPAATVIKNGATFGPHDASSPLLAGVTALGTETHQDVGLASGAVEVAKWSDGQSAVAFKGHAVGVNACVADGCDEFSGDFARLVVNAAQMRTVGQLFAPNAMCARPDTFLQTGVADGNPYTLPSGVITSWYVQDATPLASDAKLTVGRAAGADAFTLVGESTAGARTAGQVSGPFPARIPVAGGDVIGITTPGDGRCAKFTNNAADALVFRAAGPLTAQPTPVLASTGTRFPVEAIVEPDADGDGFGDLTQDRCPDVPGSANGCRSADLSLTLTASAPSVALGHEVTYTLTARNNGPDPAPDVVAANTLPGGSPTSTSLGTLASGQTASAQFTVKPSVGGAATDTATVASGSDDPDTTNNKASATTSVVAPAVLSHLTQTHRSWREPGHRARKRTPVGTTFVFNLDKRASVVLRFTQRGKTRGTLRVSGHAGTNKRRFSGSLTRARKLRRGSYTLVASAGTSSKALRFTIVR